MVNYIPEFQGYSGQGAFRYWCQKVLPLVYDDSLSYYELLNKIVVYLNNTIEDVSKAEGNIDSLLTAYTQLQNYVNNYFDNLDVQEEINNKLDAMAESGELSALLEPFIPNLVTTWLNEHITPTSPPVDDTLSISGAAADAKVTGDEIAKAIKSYTRIAPGLSNIYTSANDFPINSVIAINSGITEEQLTDLPKYGELSYVITTSYEANVFSRCQIFMSSSIFAVRIRLGTEVWQDWNVLAKNADALKYSLQTMANYNSLAELPVNIISLANNTQNFDDFPADTSSGVVVNMRYSINYMLQFFICSQEDKIRIWWRVIDKRDNSVYKPWIGLANLDEINSLKTDVVRYVSYNLGDYSSMASTPLNQIRSFNATDVSWTDIPEGVNSGSFYSMQVSPQYKMQFLYSYQGTYNIWYRIVGVSEPYTTLLAWHKVLAPEDLETLENNSMKYISSLSTYINDNNFDSLSDIKENIVAVYNSSTTFNMPDSAFSNFIFMNMRYAPNYNIQFAFTTGGKQFKYRIVDRRNGNIYTDWNAPDSFDGKVCLAMGDSICVGSRNSHYGFIGYFGLDLTKLSYVGACISNIRVTENTDTENLCIYKQFENYVNNLEHFDYYPDILIADGGINDYVYNSPLGTEPTSPVTTSAEANNLDKGTLSGGLQYLFYLWIKNYPKAQKYFLLTHKTYFTSSGTYAPEYVGTAGYNQTQMNDMIKKICNVYGVEVIDVFGKSMINTKLSQYVSPVDYDLETNTSTDKANISNSYYVDSDGIHPLALGYREGYVPFVREALKTSTKKELLSDYMYYEYDGSDDENWVMASISGMTGARFVIRNNSFPYYADYGISTQGTPNEQLNIIKSNQYPEATHDTPPSSGYETIALRFAPSSRGFQLYNSNFSNLEDFKTYLSTSPLKVIIKKPVYTTV